MTHTIKVRPSGFYWVVRGATGQPEVAFWDDKQSGWRFVTMPRPQLDPAVTVVSERLVFKPREAPVA